MEKLCPGAEQEKGFTPATPPVASKQGKGEQTADFQPTRGPMSWWLYHSQYQTTLEQQAHDVM